LLQDDGTHGLRLDADGVFDVSLSNGLDEPTLVHWHGLTPPNALDGVPDNPAPLIEAGESRRYAFPVGPGGTHWMHAHTLQEQNLLAAPLIVRTAEDRKADEQEVVVMLHDFSFTHPAELLAGLKNGSSAPHGGGMMGMMDANDVQFDAYLANDRTLPDPEVVRVDRGGRARLRIINAATATSFTLDTGALEGELIAVDGQSVLPVRNRRFPIVMGQRLDIRLELPSEGGAFPILARREGARDQTGIVLASAGVVVATLPVQGPASGPIVGLGLERRLRPRFPLDNRRPDRRLGVTLTGGMDGYEWAVFAKEPLQIRRGERVEIAMRNMSMMTHPMHLHGHHFQVVGINGRRLDGAVRDTVAVPHMAEVVIAFDAINPGKWAFHCHNLYHMAAGMMGFVTYDGTG
jgi:FtsP/CotA-like multicopper oxidase with cupredoxin domain